MLRTEGDYMLNRWVNSLVKSPVRRRKFLRTRAANWPVIIQTGDRGRLKTLRLGKETFPELIRVHVQLKPKVVMDASVTAQVQIGSKKCISAMIYNGKFGGDRGNFGRCESIGLWVKHVEVGANTEFKLNLCEGELLFRKEFHVCAESFLDIQEVVHHHLVNKNSGKKHIYPFGGYVHPFGNAEVGDAVYVTVSETYGQTKINLHSYEELRKAGVLFDNNDPEYAYELMEVGDQKKTRPLKAIVENSEIQCFGVATVGDEEWKQKYVSRSIQQKEEGKAFVSFYKTGAPKLGGR